MIKSDINRLIIIADNCEIDKQSVNQYSRDVDRATSDNVTLLKNGFEQLFNDVIVFQDPLDFVARSKEFQNDLIFPYWHGKNSRNKQALISAYCEIEKYIYIGADAYTNIVCCDKVLSKDVCRLNGLKTPNYTVVKSEIEILEVSLNFPVVVKPIYEGASLGITEVNLVHSIDECIPIVNQLIREFNQPVIIEEFIPGKEISVVMVGWGEKLKAWSAAERTHKYDENYFSTNIYSFDQKIKNNEIVLKDARHSLNASMLSKLHNVFKWLDKLEYIRIDGKIWNDEFWCFELSHDTSLNPNGAFFKPLSYLGFDFKSSLNLLVDNCLERHNSQPPSQ